MIYKNISIKNFRGIKESAIEDLSMINVFLGKNNCGKSSILEAIFLLTGQYNPQLILNIDIFRNLRHNEANDFRFIFYQLDYKHTPEVNADMFSENSKRKIKIRPKNIIQRAESKITKFNAKDYGSETDTAVQENVSGLDIFSEVKGKQSTNKALKGGISLDQSLNTREAIFTIENDKKNIVDLQGIFQHVNFNNNPQNFIQRLETLIIEKKDDELIKNLLEIDDKIKRITIGTNGVIFFDIGVDRLIPSNLMGDGILRLLSIAINLNAVKNGILLIDEIDNGLHYTSMMILWKMIFKTAKANNVQLFITTHNIDTLINLKKVLKDPNFEAFSDVIRCYTLTKDEKNVVYSYKYKFSDLDYALQQNIEIRGVF
jgi:AAA15 family ATPase/GTPase